MAVIFCLKACCTPGTHTPGWTLFFIRSLRTYISHIRARGLRRVSIENAWELRGAEHTGALVAVQGVRPSDQLHVAPSRSQLRRDARALLTDVPSTALAEVVHVSCYMTISQLSVHVYGTCSSARMADITRHLGMMHCLIAYPKNCVQVYQQIGGQVASWQARQPGEAATRGAGTMAGTLDTTQSCVPRRAPCGDTPR